MPPSRTLLTASLLAFALPGCAQAPPAERPAPYPCEGCEIIQEVDADTLASSVRIADASEPGERLVLTGRVLRADGRTPAPGVVLYFHQTGADGLYQRVGGALTIQGWLITDADGRYRVETIRPGPYPSGEFPAHVHVYVGEPGRAPYYLNDVVFEGDPRVTEAYLAGLIPHTDDGVVRLVRDGAGWRGQRDLVLVP